MTSMDDRIAAQADALLKRMDACQCRCGCEGELFPLFRMCVDCVGKAHISWKADDKHPDHGPRSEENAT